MIYSKKIWFFFPIFIFLLYTPWSAQLDQVTTQYFYTNDHFVSNSFVHFMFKYGFYPAWAVIAIAIFLLIISIPFPKYKHFRKPATYLILCLAIGAGLIVHFLLKDHWGRPRPKQVIEYGGHQPFRAYYQPNFFHQPEPSKSFPCGHCSMGFYFFSLALLGYYLKRKYLYYYGMGLAWGLGIILGYIRIAQGGHFLSDVLMSALIMWLVALGLYQLVLNYEGRK